MNNWQNSKTGYEPGNVIDNAYRLLYPLGQGGMGLVFACFHLMLEQEYAIKILPQERLNEESWKRFITEAKVLAKLNHPNIVHIYNMGVTSNNCPYIVMDLLKGITLEKTIKDSGAFEPKAAIKLFLKLAEALGAAHSKNVIHRDVKPSNIVLNFDSTNTIDSITLVDFGIARISQPSPFTQANTAAGLVFGTPYYMSPEQCDGQQIDLRSDIYSLGCTFFEALTGHPPFQGNSPFETFGLHKTAPRPMVSKWPSRYETMPDLDAAIQKMLAIEPKDRYQSMQQLIHDLERLLLGKSIANSDYRSVVSTTESDSNNSTTSTDHESTEKSKRQFSPLLGIVLVTLLASITLFRILTPTPKSTAPYPVTKVTKKLLAGKVSQSKDYDKISKFLNEGSLSEKKCLKFGASDELIAALKKIDYDKILKQQAQFKVDLKKYIGERKAINANFRNGDYFHFPEHLILGDLKTSKVVIPACGTIQIDATGINCLCLDYRTDQVPELFDLIGPSDFSGLEIACSTPKAVIKKISTWNNVKELCFFNSFTKMAPGFEDYDECPLVDEDLPSLESFTSLESLGLSGRLITAKALLRLNILKNLHTLKLKRVARADMDFILTSLQKYPNIQELWLIGEEIDDRQMVILAKLQNLRKLHLVRSEVTTNSLPQIESLTKLKTLVLDDRYTPSEKSQFRSIVEDTRFEPLVDTSHWRLRPQDKIEYQM